MSLSFMPTRPGASGQKGERPVASEATFFEALDEDMKRVGSFVESSLAQLVKRVEELDVDVTEAVR
jgi:SPX domain protein involved in polyphosphate accumulation